MVEGIDSATPPQDNSNPGSEGGSEKQTGPPRRRPLILLALVLVGATLVIYGARRYTSRQTAASAADTAVDLNTSITVAPDFTLTDINGKPLHFDDLRGKVVLLDFWATWCGPCRVEIPWFVDLYARYHQQGLEVVGVSMDTGQLEAVRSFAAEFKMNYPIVIGNEGLADKFGVFGLPTTLIVGRDGKIVDRHVGLVSRDAFEKDIKGLL
jgi:peroxiredoxin